VHALDDREFRDFVAARGHALLRTGFLLTGDQQLAEDLVQTALEHAVRRWRSIRARGAVEAYVRRTMYREQVSRWRLLSARERPVATVPEPRLRQGVEDGVENRVVLAQALMKLGAKQRTVLVLRFFEDLTEQQTADVLGVSVGTVKSQAHRGLSRLRALCPDLAPSMGGEPR
jgi:RNA polymerase sigma-70 factor (sigma-E family)